MPILPPFHVVSVSPARVAALVWHTAGEHRVTLVVKASFQLAHEGPTALVKAEPILVEDRLAPASGSLVSPGEVAPFLPGADVILRGHACAPAGQSARAMSVRLALFRERWLLDKTLHVYGDRPSKDAPPAPFSRLPIVYERAVGGPGIEDNPAGVGGAPTDPRVPNVLDPKSPMRPAGFGPIARLWSPRVRLAPRAPWMDGSVLALPDGFPFRYFHAAPPDQQLEHLSGDEWLVVEGMHPEIPRLSARLPSARGVAMRYRTDGQRAAPIPVAMVTDTLSIDMDGLVATLIFRGHFTLSPGETPASYRAFAGVELPGVPVDWPDLDDLIAPAQLSGPASVEAPETIEPDEEDAEDEEDAPERLSATAIVLPDEDVVGDEEATETEELGSTVPLRALKSTIADAPSTAAPAPEIDPLDVTRGISLAEIRARASRPVAPFALAEPGSAPKDRNAPIPGAPWSQGASRPAEEPPKVGSREPAPYLDVEAPETMDVPAGALASYLATPFGAPPAAVPSPPAVVPSPPAVVSPGSSDPLMNTRPPESVLPGGAAPPAVLPFVKVEPSSNAPPPEPARPGGAAPPAALPFVDLDPSLNAPPPELALPGVAPPPLWAGAPAAAPPPEVSSPPRPAFLGAPAVAEAAPAAPPPKRALPALAAPMLVRPTLPVGAMRAAPKPAAPAPPPKEPPKPALPVPATPVVPVKPAAASPAVAAPPAPAAPGKSDAPAGGAAAGPGGGGASSAGVGPAGSAGVGPAGPGVNTVSAFGAPAAPDLRATLAARLAAGEPVQGLDLAGADLRKMDLSRADLAGVSLRGATLAGAKLAEARLGGADLSGADLSGADLQGADLSGADLGHADLHDSKAGGANLTGANLERATFPGADLSGARLSRANLQYVTADGANLSKASLDGADLRQARLVGATLDGADLQDVSAPRADLTRASLAGAKLGNAQLRSARLREAILTRAELSGADLRDADLTRTDLRGATRGGAKLSGANLRDAVE